MFICITCAKGCSLVRPEGFAMPLPIQYSQEKAHAFMVTPNEMVSRKALLRVDEAAYCLNVSERKIYKWIDEGKLRRAREQPVRVSAEDVARCMETSVSD
jgi:excisionase family DNA binding protein